MPIEEVRDTICQDTAVQHQCRDKLERIEDREEVALRNHYTYVQRTLRYRLSLSARIGDSDHPLREQQDGAIESSTS